MVVSIDQQDDGTWARVYRTPSRSDETILYILRRIPCTKEGYLFDNDGKPIIPRRYGGPPRKNKSYNRVAPYSSGIKHKTYVMQKPRKGIKHGPYVNRKPRALGFKRGPYKRTRERLERERLAKIDNDMDTNSDTASSS